MFDVHAHLTDPDLRVRLPEVLGSASDAGVTDVMVVSEDLHDAATVLSLGGELSGVRLHKAVGMHPEKADSDSLSTVLEYIRAHVDRLACVGEIGLDYSPHVLEDNPEATKAVQQAVFTEQVRLAMELGLAVNVHSRSAGHHTIEMLKELGATRVVLHAFDGRAHYAEQGAALGYFLSVPPCVVRSPSMQKWVKRLPLDNLLLETDSPALAPLKGETNEPKNLTVSCAQIAALKGISEAESEHKESVVDIRAVGTLAVPDTHRQKQAIPQTPLRAIEHRTTRRLTASQPRRGWPTVARAPGPTGSGPHRQR